MPSHQLSASGADTLSTPRTNVNDCLVSSSYAGSYSAPASFFMLLSVWERDTEDSTIRVS